jgi:hypothetical protein
MKKFYRLGFVIVLVACSGSPPEGKMHTAILLTDEALPLSTHTPTSTVTPKPTLTYTVTPKPTSTSKPTRTREPNTERTPVNVYVENVSVEERDCEY